MNGRILSGLMETLSISPDGRALAAFSASLGASFFDIDLSTGSLSQRGCAATNGDAPGEPGTCIDMPTIVGGEGTVEFIGNAFLHYTAFNGAQFTVFDREFAPVCQPATVPVPFETAVAAPLNCSDANGHGITLSIVSGPANGTLGAINTTSNTVPYDPFAGFTGNDTFTYRGSAFGLPSAPATVTLNVAPQGQQVDPGAVDADGDGFPQSNDCNDSNPSINPGATDVAGNGVDEDCSGADGAGSTRRPRVTGDGNAGTVRVNRRRFFKLAGHKVNCSGAGPNCAVRNRATARVDFAATSALRNRRIGGSRFTVRAGRTKGIKVRLTKKAFKALKREGKLRAKVRVTVTRGDQAGQATGEGKAEATAYLGAATDR